MLDLNKKKLLVLGGTSATLNVVKEAQKLGVYVIVVDNLKTGISKKIADESYIVSTTDMVSLKKLIEERRIDGVFCGPSEFNIKNTMRLCKLVGLPFYATEKQWDICSNKANFKQLCRDHGVTCVPEYELNKDFSESELDKIEYPVIVKPVDNSSSKGISVCYTKNELLKAFKFAHEYSQNGDIIVEKYIQNGGIYTSVRYIVCDGELYLSLMGDVYVVDPINRTALISAVTLFPSKHTDMYINILDARVKDMFKSIGYKNGVLFMQSLPENQNIYFYEMGLRLSGGLTYKITEPANGINDLKMMIKYALGEPMCENEEIKRIDPYLNSKRAASLCIPLKAGTIGSIEGVNEILQTLQVEDLDFIQYYSMGDCITEDKIGTLMQHFGRFKFFANSLSEIINAIEIIQQTLEIKDINGNDMIYMRFDTNRLY